MFNAPAAEDAGEEGAEAAQRPVGGRLSHEQLLAELKSREEKMQAGGDAGETDQWRVYKHIVGCIREGKPLRIMVQASARPSCL